MTKIIDPSRISSFIVIKNHRLFYAFRFTPPQFLSKLRAPPFVNVAPGNSLKMNDLDKEQILMLKSTFDAFDVDRKGYIDVDMIGTILDMLGTQLVGEELDSIIEEVDEDGNGEVSFHEFANMAARFLVEDDEDTEAIQTELKGAFRLYDREGNGFITTEVLREILRELDEKLSEDDLDNMIEEIDADGSGTVDWEEFKAVMIG